MKQKKGFTIIELIIVAAVVAVLATIIFPSVRNAYAKAADVRRQSEMRNVRSSIILNSESNSYENIFTEEGEIKESLEDLVELTGASESEYDAISDTNYFLIVVPTKSSTEEYFCIDDTGDIQTVDRRVDTGDEKCSSLIVEELPMDSGPEEDSGPVDNGPIDDEPSYFESCSYPAPPGHCDYVPGPDYDPQTGCGMELQCSEGGGFDEVMISI